MKRTIQQQLARRHDCRYGLRGLKCHLAGDDTPYRILGSDWGENCLLVQIGEPETKTSIRDLAGFGNPHFGFAWASLLADKTVTTVGNVKKKNGITYETYALLTTKEGEQ